MTSLYCVCHPYLKRRIRTERAKNLEKYVENAESWTMEGRFLDQPDREKGNPLKPVRTRDDLNKNLAHAIFAWIRRIIRISAAL